MRSPFLGFLLAYVLRGEVEEAASMCLAYGTDGSKSGDFAKPRP